MENVPFALLLQCIHAWTDAEIRKNGGDPDEEWSSGVDGEHDSIRDRIESIRLRKDDGITWSNA